MKLSMSMISQRLPFGVSSTKSGEMKLDRFAVLSKNTVFQNTTVYLATEKMAKLVNLPKVCPIICIGDFDAEIYPDVDVLTVDKSVEFPELINAVAEVFAMYSAIEIALHECLSSRGSVQRIVDIASPLFSGNDIVVHDFNFKILAQSNRFLESYAISDLPQPENNTLSMELVNFLKSERHYTSSRTSRDVFLNEPTFLNFRIMGVNIFYQDDSACRVIMTEHNSTFSPHDLNLLRYIADFIQQLYDMAVVDMAKPPESKLSVCLSKVLHEKPANLSELKLELSAKSWSPSDTYLCMCIQTDTLAILNKVQQYYCNMLNRQWDNTCALVHEDFIVCVVNLQFYNSNAADFISQRITEMRDLCFSFGVSNVFRDISELRNAYLQSKIALDLGQKESPQKWKFNFSDCALTYICNQITAELDVKYIVSNKLSILLEYDERNNTEYAKTLLQYIKSGKNVVQSAKDLFIHRATMIYRLSRICELTGLNLDDPNEMMYFHLSCMLMDL